MRPTQEPGAKPSAGRQLLFHDESLCSFCRRPAWSPEGTPPSRPAALAVLLHPLPACVPGSISVCTHGACCCRLAACCSVEQRVTHYPMPSLESNPCSWHARV